MNDTALIELARMASDDAYAPYSSYNVGAVIEAGDGSQYTGCNIENVNYSNSLHAEEVAIAKAIMDGHREFSRIAISTDRLDGVTPCGMCRQTLIEFADPNLRVLCDMGDSYAEYTLTELLPQPMKPSTLE